jgi:hypothetical protein
MRHLYVHMLFHYADTYVGFAHYVLFVNVRTQNLDASFVLLAIPTLKSEITNRKLLYYSHNKTKDFGQSETD